MSGVFEQIEFEDILAEKRHQIFASIIEGEWKPKPQIPCPKCGQDTKWEGYPYAGYKCPNDRISWGQNIEDPRYNPYLKPNTKSAGSDHHNGMMVAILPPEDIIKRLTFPGGEDPKELHITLTYMGDITDYDSTPEDALEELEQALREISTTSLSITIEGSHTFPPKDGQYPLVAGVTVTPKLQDLRDQVVDLCNTTQFNVDMTFPEYKPHITLKYFDENEPTPNISVPKMTFEANVITIVVAGQSRFLDIDDLW